MVQALRQLGYDAYSVAQEHSHIRRMWALRHPDFVVFLDCTYETALKRRAVPWSRGHMDEQRKRLADARAHCDLFVQTDGLSPAQVVDLVVEAIRKVEGDGLCRR